MLFLDRITYQLLGDLVYAAFECFAFFLGKSFYCMNRPASQIWKQYEKKTMASR